MGTKKAQEFFDEATRYGLPSFDNLRFRQNYIVSYDNSLKHPKWVLECLKGTRMKRSKSIHRLTEGFDIDESVHERFRATDDDYRDSGFDRGHYSAPSNNKCHRGHLDQAYLYSNVAPQVHGLDRNPRVLARLQSYMVYVSCRSKSTHIITGSLYLPERVRTAQGGFKEEVKHRVIGQNRVAVPDFFYKIIVHESSGGIVSMEASVLPNSEELDGSEEVDQYRININRDLWKIEEFTGLKFFDLLPRTSTLLPTTFQYGFQELVSGSYEHEKQYQPGFNNYPHRPFG